MVKYDKNKKDRAKKGHVRKSKPDQVSQDTTKHTDLPKQKLRYSRQIDRLRLGQGKRREIDE